MTWCVCVCFVCVDKKRLVKTKSYLTTDNVFFLVIFALGIQKLMVPGTSVKSSKEALRLTRLYPGIIYSTAGNGKKTKQTTN